jgi:hypothetical protein
MEKETTYLVLAALAIYVMSRKSTQRAVVPANAGTGGNFAGTGSSLTDIIKTASEAYRAYDRQEWEQSQAEKRAASSNGSAPTQTPEKAST